MKKTILIIVAMLSTFANFGQDIINSLHCNPSTGGAFITNNNRAFIFSNDKPRTFSIWAKQDTATSVEQDIFAIGSTTDTLYKVYLNNNTISFNVHNNIVSGSYPNDNQWHNITCVSDTTHVRRSATVLDVIDTLSIYIDGVFVNGYRHNRNLYNVPSTASLFKFIGVGCASNKSASEEAYDIFKGNIANFQIRDTAIYPTTISCSFDTTIASNWDSGKVRGNYSCYAPLTSNKNVYYPASSLFLMYDISRTSPCTPTSTLVSNVSNVSNINVYPNPTSDVFNIVCDREEHITIYDMIGHIVYDNTNVSTTTIRLSTGTYILNSSNAQQTIRTKLIVQ
jgi:hypothetical protein